tara:strand:- start:59 stop:511 length:453 start_codon:yes stop_codon:yes gene_type:complete
MNSELLFLIFNALIGFFSDVVINILTHMNLSFLNSLKPYFENKSVFKAAFYASITVLIIVAIIMKIFNIIYDKYLPESQNEYIIFIILTFVIGFISDIIINRINIFPRLKKYYKDVGEGLWGGLAIVFSVIISLILLYIYNNYDKFLITR